MCDKNKKYCSDEDNECDNESEKYKMSGKRSKKIRHLRVKRMSKGKEIMAIFRIDPRPMFRASRQMCRSALILLAVLVEEMEE